jgi:glucosamine--fructose-6-phosphate aminotransferase (isomerizing)
MQQENGKFTREEILSQPDTWAETLAYLEKDWKSGLPDVGSYDEVILSGCGSTYYLSIWAARLLQRKTGVTCIPVPGSEIWYSGKEWIHPDRKTLFIAISRSGLTTETLHALDYFLKAGQGDALAVTCYGDSPLAKSVPKAVITSAGMENSVAQTRSFTNMMWALMRLANGEIPSGLPARVNQVGKQLLADYQSTSREIGANLETERFFFLGDGPLYGLALEVMLKMKEMSLSYSEAYHFLEFRHGPMSVVNDRSLVIGLANPQQAAYEMPVLQQMRELGARTLAVGGQAETPAAADTFYRLDGSLPYDWSFATYLPLIQLIAFERSLAKGLNPDKPENLTSVVEL